MGTHNRQRERERHKKERELFIIGLILVTEVDRLAGGLRVGVGGDEVVEVLLVLLEVGNALVLQETEGLTKGGRLLIEPGVEVADGSVFSVLKTNHKLLVETRIPVRRSRK